MLTADPHSKEVLCYREALWHGFRSSDKKPLSTNLFIEIVKIIKGIDIGIRRVPGTKIANSKGQVIYTPPEGESLIRDKLANLEKFIHTDNRYDPLVMLGIIHYQFEAIHPFVDGNGRTGRILNILFLVEKGLLDTPILFLSHYILRTKSTYLDLLRRVTEKNAWTDFVLYMLDAIEITAIETQQRVEKILIIMEKATKKVRSAAPKIYSKDLIETIFMYPYCKVKFLEKANIAKRQTAAEYLKVLEKLGLLKSFKFGREHYYINQELIKILSK